MFKLDTSFDNTDVSVHAAGVIHHWRVELLNKREKSRTIYEVTLEQKMYTNIEGEVIQCVERRVSIIRLYLVNHDEWDLDVYSRCILCSHLYEDCCRVYGGFCRAKC